MNTGEGVTDSLGRRIAEVDTERMVRDLQNATEIETGSHLPFEVGPVSIFCIDRAVQIDSTWNPRPWSEKLFRQEFNNPAARIRGVFDRGDLIGYLIAHIVMDEAHIVSLGVAAEYRRQGAGRTLLKDFIRYAACQGVEILTLDVRISNVVAQNLYHSFGFEVAGVRPKYYSSDGEDALSMRLELTK